MNAIVPALINGIILSAPLAAVLWLVLRLAPRRVLNAATRYAVWWAALAVVCALPCLYLMRPGVAPARAAAVHGVTDGAADFTINGIAIALAPEPLVRDASRARPADSPATQVGAVVGPVPQKLGMEHLERPVDRRKRLSHFAQTLASLWDRRFRLSNPSHTASDGYGAERASAVEPSFRPSIPWPRFPIVIPAGNWPRWVMGLWLLTSAAMLIRLAVSWALLQRCCARGFALPEPLRIRATRWLELCGSTRRNVRFVCTTGTTIPAASGPLRPAILIPANLLDELDDAALDQVCLHEAAHLARRDDYALAIQRLIEALFALHPVARWIARRIDLEREIACDDFVLAATGQSHAYATCLTRMVELTAGERPSPAAAASSHLAHRVEFLLDKTRHAGTRLLKARLTVIVALLALMAWMVGRSPGLLAFAAPAGHAVLRAVLPQRAGLAPAAHATASRTVPALLAAAVAQGTAFLGEVAQQTTIISVSKDREPVSKEPPPPPSKPEDLCTLEGRVVNELTGEPLDKVRIYISGSRAGSSAKANYTTVSDASGKFVAKGFEPGAYRVSANRAAFLTGRYGATAAEPNGKELTFAPSQRVTGVDIQIKPYAVIAGRVVNRSGEPMVGYKVTPCRFEFENGRRMLVEASGAPSTDDQGRYRTSGLPPGRYYIHATRNPSGRGSDAEFDRSAKPRREDYVVTYYPGTPDGNSAAAIDLTAGQALEGVNITLAKSAVTQVSGRVVNQAAEKFRSRGPGYVNLQPSGTAEFWGAQANLSPDGEFEFHGVAPGSYIARVTVFLEARGSRRASQAVTVGDKPVENLSIPVVRPGEIAGAVKVEGAKRPDLGATRVGLRVAGKSAYGYSVDPVALDADGTFHLAEVSPESYFLDVRKLPEGFYIKSARFGEADALAGALNVVASAPLEIALSDGAANVSGVVKGGDGAPVDGVTVALVPQEAARQGQPYYYQSAKSNAGQYAFRNLPPGEYRLYAWTEVENGAWTSAEVLARFESQAKAVSLREAGSATVELQAIPAGK